MKVLIADDSIDFCTTLADIVEAFEIESFAAHSPEEAVAYIDKFNRKLNAVLLDIEFGPETQLTGLDVLAHCRRYYPALPVIMISGKGTIETAVKATKLGAVNFIEKSIISKEKLKEVLLGAVAGREIKSEAREIQMFLESSGLIGKSKSMIETGDNIIRYGRTDLNVLVTGETGTGKKLVAKAIHGVSRRAKAPFVTVDIPNIPRDLFQSELFGHNKGAFSGAVDTKKGLFQRAHKGTLFLDEIGDLSTELQSNLFIPIEERTVRKVGSTEPEELDVRFVSATDKDLVEAMTNGQFREQLYHRLRECEIRLAPLRERREDIPAIIEFFTARHNKEFGEMKFFSPSAIEFMQEQAWKGNVRELSSVTRVTLQTAKSDRVETSDMTGIITAGTPVVVAELNNGRSLKEDIAEVDKIKIESTLERTSGNVSKAAALLDISRETLHNKIRRYGINADRFRKKR